jgi:hypothetical protein
LSIASVFNLLWRSFSCIGSPWCSWQTAREISQMEGNQ